VRIVSPESHQLLVELPVAALEIGFSPRGTFLSTLERYVKHEDGTQNKNLRVWNAETGAELASFSQRASDGWWVTITPAPLHDLRKLSGISSTHPTKPTPFASLVMSKSSTRERTSPGTRHPPQSSASKTAQASSSPRTAPTRTSLPSCQNATAHQQSSAYCPCSRSARVTTPLKRLSSSLIECTSNGMQTGRCFYA
jgi:hypothetical protein